MKINFFKNDHSLFPFRWLITAFILSSGTLFYYDYSGDRLLSFSQQQQWNNSGPGYHK